MEDVTAKTYKQRAQSAGTRRRIAGEAGQALLELAFLAPMLCLLSIGIVDLGRAVSATIAVNNAATAGVEYGAQNSTTANDITGMENAAKNDTLHNYLPPGTPPAGSMTAVATNGCACDNGTGTSCSPMPATGSCATILANCATGQVVQCVQVTTSLHYGPTISYPGLPGAYTANGSATMRVRH